MGLGCKIIPLDITRSKSRPLPTPPPTIRNVLLSLTWGYNFLMNIFFSFLAGKIVSWGKCSHSSLKGQAGFLIRQAEKGSTRERKRLCWGTESGGDVRQRTPKPCTRRQRAWCSTNLHRPPCSGAFPRPLYSGALPTEEGNGRPRWAFTQVFCVYRSH